MAWLSSIVDFFSTFGGRKKDIEILKGLEKVLQAEVKDTTVIEKHVRELQEKWGSLTKVQRAHAWGKSITYYKIMKHEKHY